MRAVPRRSPPVRRQSFERIVREVGQRVQEARLEAKLTQEEAALRAGLGYKRWQDIEQGRQGSTLKTLVRVSNALGVSFWELLTKR